MGKNDADGGILAEKRQETRRSIARLRAAVNQNGLGVVARPTEYLMKRSCVRHVAFVPLLRVGMQFYSAVVERAGGGLHADSLLGIARHEPQIRLGDKWARSVGERVGDFFLDKAQLHVITAAGRGREKDARNARPLPHGLDDDEHFLRVVVDFVELPDVDVVVSHGDGTNRLASIIFFATLS